MNYKIFSGITCVFWLGSIGLFLPQHLPSTQRLQALFFHAEEQLDTTEECSAVANGVYPITIEVAPVPCEAVARVRYAYDGLTYTMALQQFKTGIRQDQLMYAALLGISGLMIFLGYLFSLKSYKRIIGR